MAMVVQHNMQAMNANRMLGVTTGQQAKSTEKLSSGFKINRAADDAAGLSISEKMRKQIKGLNKASSNAQDGISAVQTAEGALTEVHSMLQRMNELATQASNGTNSDTDRKAIQDEIDQLTTEIDRVSETTKFNETYLLKGNGATKKSTVNAHDAGLAGKLADNGDGTSTFKLNDELKNGSIVNIAGKDYTIGITKTDDDFSKASDAVKTSTNATVLKNIGDSATNGENKYTVVGDITVAAASTAAWAQNDKITLDGVEYTVSATATDAVDAANGTVGKDHVAELLKQGATITKNAALKIGTGTTDVVKSMNVVNALNEGEISITDGTTLDAKRTAIAAGDTVTTDGKTTKVYDDTTNTGGVSSFDKISKEIKELQDDGTKEVEIDGTTYIVGLATDEKNGVYTAEDILSKIKEGSSVVVDSGNAKYIYGVDEAAPEGSITKEEAYRKMADELTKASSIGTDKGSEAKTVSNGDGSFTITQGTVNTKESLSFSLHVGADADMTNKISVEVESMNSANLGIKGINVNDETGAAATYAIDAISDAISKVSSQRSALGAVQNRLEHTISNLDNVAENTTSAESAIRDTDMATEMVNYSKNNILAQAGQSMLAQANQSTQGVLSILG